MSREERPVLQNLLKRGWASDRQYTPRLAPSSLKLESNIHSFKL